MINSLNELSDKFGYTMKTFNILGMILIIQGELDKALAIFDNVIKEYNVFDLPDDDPLLAATNQDLQCLLYNYIKCTLMVNSH